MAKRGMLAAVAIAVGVGVAMKRRAATPSARACALLEQLVMTQRSVDAHIQMPKDFAYVPFEMVEACGSASFRMPYPYKIRLPSHRPLDQLSIMHRCVGSNFCATKQERLETSLSVPNKCDAVA